MPRPSSRKTAKKATAKQPSKANAKPGSELASPQARLWNQTIGTIRWVGRVVMVPINRLRGLRARRTHKSLQMSRRRDYIRPLSIPGYFAYTAEVAVMLFRNKRIFIMLSLVGTSLILVLGGLSSHQLYSSVSESIAGGGEGTPLALQVGTLALSAAGLMSAGASEAQQIYIAIVGLLTWLTSVWLLREILAGQRPRLRDGLYSAGSPIVASAIVALLLLLQLVPVGLLALVFTALSATGLIAEGLGAFLFFGVAALIVTLTLYWITSTLFAMVIITLPGMYPWRAMRAASDIVVGRRLRMLYRIIWMIAQVAFLWFLVMSPIILLNIWFTDSIKWFSSVPLVPIVSAWLTMAMIIWASAYVYLLYRKVVASDAQSSS